MKKIALLLGLLLASPAFAADNAVIVTPGVGVTMKSKDIGAGVQAMQPILSDASGNALLTTLGADAVSNTLTGLPVYSRGLVFNGTTWDRWTGAVTVSGVSTAANQTTINTSIGTTNTTLTSTNTKLDTIITNTGAAIPAGTASIGAVGADPSLGKATPTSTFLALPATTTTQIVALSGSKVTYVTSYRFMAGGTVNVTFKYGTGSNCGTGTTTLEGPWPLTAQAGMTAGSGLGAIMIVPSAQALCVTTDASVTGGVALSYQQF